MSLIWFGAAAVAVLLYGSASVVQAYAARRASGPAVLRHPAYLSGLTFDGLAFAAQAVAMRGLPIFTVQSILSGSLAITMLLGIAVLRLRPTRRDWFGVGLTTAGVAIVSVAGGPAELVDVPGALRVALALGMVVTLLASVALYRRGAMVAQALVAGLSFALTALFMRMLTQLAAPGLAWLSLPELYLLGLSGLVGTVMYARALEHGQVGTPTAVLWVIEVIVPGVIGLLALGDTVRHGWQLPTIAGVAAAVAGCVVLALSPTQEQVSAEPSATRPSVA